MNLLLRLSSSSSKASSYYYYYSHHSPSLLFSSSSSHKSCKKAFFHHYFRQKKKNDVATTAVAARATISCRSLMMKNQHRHQNNNNIIVTTTKRTHYSYSGPGSYGLSGDNDHDNHHRHNWYERGYTVGIGGPVGSGKTALVLSLTKLLTNEKVNLGVVTNDIFTQEDAQFLSRNNALPDHLIRAVETGGCPHAAIREDVSSNLTACEDLTRILLLESKEEEEEESNNNNTNNQQRQPSSSSQQSSPQLPPIPMILCESGGDNLAANFSRELADLTLYVIDVAGGDKVPRKGGPGITQSDLLIINKIDLAEAVGSDLNVMERDANKMRKKRKMIMNNDDDDDTTGAFGPTIFASVKHGTGIEDIKNFILNEYHAATTTTTNDD